MAVKKKPKADDLSGSAPRCYSLREKNGKRELQASAKDGDGGEEKGRRETSSPAWEAKILKSAYKAKLFFTHLTWSSVTQAAPNREACQLPFSTLLTEALVNPATQGKKHLENGPMYLKRKPVTAYQLINLALHSAVNSWPRIIRLWRQCSGIRRKEQGEHAQLEEAAIIKESEEKLKKNLVNVFTETQELLYPLQNRLWKKRIYQEQ